MAANLTAALTARLIFPAPGGVSQNSSNTVSAPFQGGGGLYVDVPDTTAADTVIPLSFGSVESATALKIVNGLGQEVGVKINGGDPTPLPAGGILSWASPTTAETPIASADIVLSVQQDGTERLEYWVLGDPTEA